MQLHQTPQWSPRRVVVPSPRLVFLAFLLLVTSCGTAEDFSEDVAFIETDTVDLDTQDDPSGTAAEVDSATETPQADSASSMPSPTDAPDARPVLEVTSDPAADQAEAQTAPATADQPASDPATPATGADDPTAAPGTEAPTTDGSTQSTPAQTTPEQTTPPATAPPETTPPATVPPATEAPAPPATETPVAAPPQATKVEPNCAVLCNIAMEGDSLTVGLGNRLCGAVQTGTCINSGIVGRRVDEMIVTARTDVDNQLGPDGNDVLILWGGTNDLWQKFHSTDPATNAAAIYEQIKIFVAERRASGWDYVYVMTLPPMNPTYVVGTEPLNDLIRQNAAGADGVLDVGADARLANAFDPAMRAADGIHFGDGGRAVVMEYIFGAIADLDGA